MFANRETSFFDIGDVKFGNRIRLREHFRCVPEIIEYCNKRFYNGQKLIPLRQFGSDRLKPIKPIYVNNGFNEGEGQNIKNEEEANQIVNTIKNCIDDEKYKNKNLVSSVLEEVHKLKLLSKN